MTHYDPKKVKKDDVKKDDDVVKEPPKKLRRSFPMRRTTSKDFAFWSLNFLMKWASMAAPWTTTTGPTVT